MATVARGARRPLPHTPAIASSRRRAGVLPVRRGTPVRSTRRARRVGAARDRGQRRKHHALRPFALAHVGGTSLELYWLDAYGGGIFLPCRDETSWRETYGAGRYLLDTVKGADLGGTEDTIVLDFNFAFNPSCAWDDRWACPLTPPANRLDLRIAGGELIPPAAT